jgi:putative autoinducer-2 (AI-2) aldolase
MSWGLQNRLARVIRPETGRTVMLAVDHGYFLGPTSGLEDARATVAPLLPHADSLMCTRGLLRTSVDPATRTPVVLRVSGGSSILKELSNEEITTSLEEALRLNCAGVGMSIFVGAEFEKQTLTNLGRLVGEAERYGMPVLAITAVGKEMDRDLRYLSLACRIAAEYGAHFVKTYHCEGFDRLIATTPIPVVIAGGKKVPEKEALALAHEAVRAGAAGVDMGRNLFQSEWPVAMIRATRAVVHERRTPQEAFELFEELRRGTAGRRLEAVASTPDF